MNKIRLGDYNTLKMVKVAERPNPHSFGGKETFGIFLDGGQDGEILMPQKYVPQGVKVGDEIRCFVYLDQEERPIATLEVPLARVGDFAYLKVNWVNEYGAFLDWGLMKDVFCPFREQKKRMEIGDSYIVYLYVDEESYRIVSSAKIDKFLIDFNEDSEEHRRELYEKQRTGAPVELLVWQKSDLGFKVIVENRYAGLIYKNQIFQYVHTGDRLQGYVQKIRSDGKMDISLQPVGRRQTLDFAETLLQWLHENGGHCSLGDKSDAEDIKRQFHVSKKTYKRALGDLYKRRLITFTDEGISLV
ncbi:MAG: S1 RNA-binding domain-containing protein [Prevotella sp.]|jgi:predicted RNA-binding protein (virulence factor B family)